MIVASIATLALAADFVTFERAGGKAIEASSGRPYEVDPDEVVRVVVDEAALRREYGAAAPADGPSREAEIQRLGASAALLLHAQEQLAEVVALGDQLHAADEAEAPGIRTQFEVANKGFATLAKPALQPFVGCDKDGTDPVLCQGVRNAILAQDYVAAAEVIARRMEALADDLARRERETPRVEIVMHATLVTEVDTRPLHLAGYDEVASGPPALFARYQLAVDARTRTEVEAAGAWKETLEAQGGLSGSVASLQAALEADLRTLASGLGDPRLAEALAAWEKKAALDTSLAPTVELVANLRRLVVTAQGFGAGLPAGASDAETLLRLVDQLTRVVADAQRVARTSPEAVAALRAALGKVGASTERVALLKELDRLDAVFSEGRLVAELEGIARSLGFVSDAGGAAVRAASVARALDGSSDLDTRIDLRTAGERHAGDFVTLEVEVRRVTADGKPAVLRTDLYDFRVQPHGLYVQSRGALLFAEALDGSTERHFHPAVAIAFMAHAGIPRAPAWNQVLDLAIGPTVSLPDFSPDVDLEVGVGVGVSLADDLLLAGVAYDLQAPRLFGYVGLNPLLLTRLVQRGW